MFFWLAINCLVADDAIYPPWPPVKDASSLINAVRIGMEKQISQSGTFDNGPIPTSASEAFQIFQQQMNGLQIDSMTKIWDKAGAIGRMDMPKITIQQDFWFCGTWLPFYFPDDSIDTNIKYSLYRYSWRLAMRGLPQQTFSLMAADAARADVKTSDLLRLSAALGYQVTKQNGGVDMVGSPFKADWQALYNSSNPCYRIIAFEYYDKVGLTPQELLSVYEAALFHSCSYVEMRILAGIKMNHDYRLEVKQLLQQYLAGNPLLNDGTQLGSSDLNIPFKDVRVGAQSIIDDINAGK